jgi:predicted membrane protein
MKKTLWQQVMPHLISVAIFLVVALIFCKPALESDVVMKQGDITNWEGMVHQSQQYKEKHGHYPLWITSMYAGMPGYQVAMEGPWTPLGYVDRIIQLGLPKPINFFFLACITFYFLCIVLRIRPWVAVIGGVAFAYSSTFPQFITAGHDTQMLALAYAPAVLAGIMLLFDKKYISGLIVTALFTSIQVAQGHQQISYYMFLVIGIISLFFLIQGIRAGKAMLPLKAIGFAAAAVVLGVATNAVSLLTVYDYSKESKRAGQLIMDKKQNPNDVMQGDKTKGLSKDYAFDWSYGWDESLTLMFPGVKGYGSHYAERDGEQDMYPKLGENSHIYKQLTEKMGAPEDQAANLTANASGFLYWGDQPFTSGPIYLGAIVCMLFILSMVYLDGKHKWWIFTAAVLGVLLALGKHFPAFNYFLFDYLPFYNKFRVPTMALEITGLVIPIGVALGLEKLVSDTTIDMKKIRLAAMITGAVFLFAAALYFTSDYSSENKQRTAAVTQALSSPDKSKVQQAMNEINNRFKPETDNKVFEQFLQMTRYDAGAARGLLTAIRADRQAAFGSTIVRSLIFVLIAMGVVYLFISKKINAVMMIAGLGLLTAIDLITFDSNYLNKYNFGSKENYEASEFPLSPADQTILQDKDPNFRVLNTTSGNPFVSDSRTSYYHKSIGGYHPARLGIYDDLMEYQLYKYNMSVLNMLNVKYFIQQDQQGGVGAAINPNALGNVWFVNTVKYVNGPVEEMKALDSFDARTVAIVDNKFQPQLSGAVAADCMATINQTAFDNENIKYESNSNAPHVAVFSEIYYKDWKAYIDGKETPIAKANYVLRAMLIPAGKHNIEFKFEPAAYRTGSTITAISGWLVSLLLLGFIVFSVRPLLANNRK